MRGERCRCFGGLFDEHSHEAGFGFRRLRRLEYVTASSTRSNFPDKACFEEGAEDIHGTLARDFERGPDFGGGHAAVVTKQLQKAFLAGSKDEF